MLNSVKQTKRRKKFDKSKELDIELVKIKFANKIQVVNKILHEFKQEILVDYTGEFEMVGNLSLGDPIIKTHKRFGNMDDFERYINAIDEGNEAEDAIFNGYNYKINTPQFNLANRSQYGNGCYFKHEIIDYRGNNCFVPTKNFCFVKCN